MPAGPPLVVAHRGYSGVAPENTLPAFAAAIAVGVAYVEIDVRTTADGVPVVLHDPTVDRTTDGSGEVGAMTLAAVRRLDAGSWFSPAFAGLPVPTLDEALRLVRPSPALLMLEIKRPSTAEETKAIIAALVEHDMTDRVVLQSFAGSILTDSRDLAPELPRALLCHDLADDPVAVTRDLGVRYYNPRGRYLLQRLAEVDRLRAAGVGVMPWTVDAPGPWRELTEAGVAGIITNRAGELSGWLRRDHASAPAGAPDDLPVHAAAGGPPTLSTSPHTGRPSAE